MCLMKLLGYAEGYGGVVWSDSSELLLWFMQNNGILYLVALTLMIAESRMDEMDILVKVVVNLINRKQ